MCEYCYIENNAEVLKGEDGIFYDEEKERHYLYIEHFHNEVIKIAVNYCPKCGLKLG